MNVSVLTVVFHQQFSKNWQFQAKLSGFFNCVGEIGHNSALHITSYLSIALPKILSNSKTTKNATKLSVFGENDSCRLSDFDHISRVYNQINYWNISFAKVTIILIMMAQVLFFVFFFEKDPHLNAVECSVTDPNT